MRVLALDASTELCSAALLWDGNVRSLAEETPRAHSQLLPAMVDSLLSDAGATLAGLDALAVGRGPGGFTGVRIGIAYAQGLALSVNKPVYGISTLAMLAQQANDAGLRGAVVTALDARMGELYVARWHMDGAVITAAADAQVLPPDALSRAVGGGDRVHVVGSAWPLYEDALRGLAPNVEGHGGIRFPHATAAIVLASHAVMAGMDGDVALLEPLYLRNNVVSLPKS